MSKFIKNIFNNTPVRAIDRNNQIWFVAVDVCNALEINNPSQALKRLDEDERLTLTNNEGRGGQGAQSYNIINESGLYSLVLRSRKIAAKKFKKWVTSEVLPTIRKTGNYSLTINTEQQHLIKKAVNEKAYHTGLHHQTIYSQFYNTFNIPKYQDLLAKDFSKAIDFLKVEQFTIKTKDEVKIPFFLNEVADYMVRVRSGKICRYKLAYITVNTDYDTEYGTLLVK